MISSESSFKSWLNEHRQLLLLSVMGVFLPIGIFIFLALGIARQPEGFPWDVPILLFIHTEARSQLDIFAATLTQFGIYWGVVPLIIAIAVTLSFQKKWRAIIYLFITAVGTAIISHTSKLYFHRVRPSLWEHFYPLPPDFSFPSGHALSSMMLFVTLIILTWGTRWFAAVLFIGSFFVLGIGWTRLYLGVHYPTDILGGWMLAIAWSIGVSLIVKPNKL
ncbi:phosphatase PAP2 family protein [Gloeothece verrucosa]|uniref:Phosphoesterase PA-phosphatase related protein n=1 Tax=Gloeothece verrucosa (strain PCC 7822) TaxID=497965 RepID=E0UBT9_GLOV7|nr:phosphatase PAP2 family protein [Gloeothece verrucosa]ADN15154.1 phosphoesterase PA-phosphatase related protein [Gloeothece verrucosa PCC 7822]